MELAFVGEVMAKLVIVAGEIYRKIDFNSKRDNVLFPDIFTVTTGRWTQPTAISIAGQILLNYHDNRYPLGNDAADTLASWMLQLNLNGIELTIDVYDITSRTIKDSLRITYNWRVGVILLKGEPLLGVQVEHIDAVLKRLHTLLSSFVQE